MTDVDYTHSGRVNKSFEQKKNQENIVIYIFKAIHYCQLMYLRTFFMLFCRYAKANGKYMKDINKSKESSYFKYWDINNLYGCEKSHSLLLYGFK